MKSTYTQINASDADFFSYLFKIHFSLTSSSYFIDKLRWPVVWYLSSTVQTPEWKFTGSETMKLQWRNDYKQRQCWSVLRWTWRQPIASRNVKISTVALSWLLSIQDAIFADRRRLTVPNRRDNFAEHSTKFW